MSQTTDTKHIASVITEEITPTIQNIQADIGGTIFDQVEASCAMNLKCHYKTFSGEWSETDENKSKTYNLTEGREIPSVRCPLVFERKSDGSYEL